MPSHYQQGSNVIKYIVSNSINEYIHVIWLYGIYQAIITFHIVLKQYSIILDMGSYQYVILLLRLILADPLKMIHGIYIMGYIWQPFWILQEKLGISFYF